MSAPCDCPAAGYCQRHKMHKDPHLFGLCRTREDYRSLWDKAAAGESQQPRSGGAAAAQRMTGPGAQLKGIFRELGFESCGVCDGWACKMDAWGPDGCREHAAEIVERLRTKAAELGWGDRLKLVGRTATSGWVLKINWLDPFASLLETAIRRSEHEAAVE